MSHTNGDKPEIESLREQLQYLWAKMDRIHSMVWDKEKAGSPLTHTEVHIRDLAGEAIKNVPYPGEPAEGEAHE
jgi:hypothetical protein